MQTDHNRSCLSFLRWTSALKQLTFSASVITSARINMLSSLNRSFLSSPPISWSRHSTQVSITVCAHCKVIDRCLYGLGESVQEITEQRAAQETLLAELGSATFFDMVVQHNLLHADLHPGNILVEYAPPKTRLHYLLERISRRMDAVFPSKTWNPIPRFIAKLNDGKELHPNIILLDAGGIE